MKRDFFAAVIAAAGFLMLGGCQNPSSLDGFTPGQRYAEECWGEWIRMDEDETWYISGSSIKINGAVASKSVSLVKQSDRVIEVDEGGRKENDTTVVEVRGNSKRRRRRPRLQKNSHHDYRSNKSKGMGGFRIGKVLQDAGLSLSEDGPFRRRACCRRGDQSL